MLRLEVDKTDQPDDDYRPPKYIQLSGASNILGRGYQASVRLPFAWVSRKHATITRVDGNCIIESHGQNGVFVNNKRVTFTRLNHGDEITMGGGRKSSHEGDPFTVSGGPYITFSYHKSAKEMKDKENCYRDPTNPDDVMQLQDIVNGQVVNTTYHLEDFNETDELTAEDNMGNVTLVNQSLVATPKVAKLACIAPRPSTPEPMQPAISNGATRSVPTTPSISTPTPAAPTVSTPTSGLPKRGMVIQKKDGEKVEASPSIKLRNPISSPLIKQRVARKGRAAATACREMLSTLGKGDSKKTGDSEEKTNQESKKPVKKAGRTTKRAAKANSAVKPDPDVKSEPTGDVKLEPVSSDVKTERKPDIKPEVKTEDVKAEEHESVCESSVIATVPLSLGCEETVVTSKILPLEFDIDAECCITESTAPKCVVLDRYGADSDSDVEFNDVEGYANRKSSRKRKRVSYLINSQSGEEDEDYLPDPNEVKDDDVNDPDVLVSANELKSIIHPSKKARLDNIDKMYPIGSGKGKATGRGKAKNKKGAVQIDPEEQRILNSWFNKVIPRPPSRMVEVLNGLYRRSLYAFNDKEVFQVTYKNGEDKNAAQTLFETSEYDVIVNLDAALFEYKLKLGLQDDTDMVRVQRLIRKSSTTLTIKDYDQPNPASKIKRVAQPDAMTIPLKQYQMDTLGWMCLVESQVDMTWSVSKLADWPEAEIDLGFDVVNKRVYFPPVPSIPSTEYRVSIKGGILADEMGLGKTITLLSLITAHPGTELPRIPSPDVFRKHEELQLPTRATLVIAPSHLTAQWKLEAEKTAPSLNVILITTKPQFEKYSYVDILRADLVVVSVQFLLTNKAYTTMPTGADAQTSFMNLLHKSGVNPLQQKAPNFGHFDWWRLVCDEAHELITYESKFQGHKQGYAMQASSGLLMLEKLQARHKWYMTGTPLPHAEKSLRGALQFLEMKIDDPTLTYPDGSLKVDQEVSSYSVDFASEGLYLSPIHKFLLDTVYVRNTKQSIGMEYNVPEYTEELMMLTMSDVERGIYDRSTAERERRQLCCHLQIASRVQMIAGVQQKSLEEVKEAMIDHTRKEIDRSIRSIESTKEDIKRTRTEIAAESKPSMRTLLENRVKRYQESIKSYEDTIKRHNSSLAYFENIVPRVTQSADEPCVICMDNIETLTLTPCGHLYCKKCIQPYVQRTPQCPTCRKHCAESDLVEVKDPRQRENLNKTNELQKLTEQFGTKMAYLIFYIRHMFKNDPKSRVIVFSQWDELLHKIGSTLNDNGIRNVFVKGNVHVRNKAIMSFRKQEKTRVIMLSLQNAASGTNLVEASHVILIDPVAGSKEEAVAIESQAIGRAHRMGQDKEIRVVRMIVQDTIEHELYLRNNSDSIQQVELNFDQDEVSTHGPQVIRKVRKVPKPTVLAASTTSVFANDGASTSTSTSTSASSRATSKTSTTTSRKRRNTGGGGRRKRAWGWGFGRRRRFWDPWGDDYDDEHNEDDTDGCNCGSCQSYW